MFSSFFSKKNKDNSTENRLRELRFDLKQLETQLSFIQSQLASVLQQPAQQIPVPPQPAAARFYAYLGQETALTKTHHGHMIFIDTNDRGISTHLASHGIWEMHVENLICHLLKPGDRVIEVGANKGFHTLHMAYTVGAKGKIYSFECNPSMLTLLRQTVAINGLTERVSIYPYACMDRIGTEQLYVDEFFPTSAIIGTEKEPHPGLKSIEVSTTTLDEQLAEVESIDFIRIDAEGCEFLILKGGQKLIDRSPRVTFAIEWCVPLMERHHSVPDFCAWLKARGFRLWQIHFDNPLTPVTFEEAPLLPHCDLFISREDPPAGLVIRLS